MPAGKTYEPIATTTISGSPTSYTFTSIPQSYTDLVLVFVGDLGGTTNFVIRVGNGSIDTGTNYSTTILDGNGSAAVSASYTNSSFYLLDYNAASSGNQRTFTTNLFNYSNTTTYKTFLTKSALPSAEVVLGAGLWRSTSAINQIKVFGSGETHSIANGSMITLYGIKAA